MKTATGAAAAALILCGCGGGSTLQWARAPEVSDAACTASCNEHYQQCPQIFAEFPERGAVECPAEHNNCLKACANAHPAGHIAATPAAIVPPPAATLPPAAPAVVAPVTVAPAAAVTVPAAASSAPRAEPSKEAKLRELKHFHDEGLVSEDVYRDRQKAILAEP
jgi:hypothetical protein